MIRNKLRDIILGITLLVAAPGVQSAVAADSQPAVSYQSFHDRLQTSGAWSHNDRWGDVWRPNGVAREWRPYFDGGHWAYTADYGWFWDGDAPWGDIVYHYGRWVFDPTSGWMWVPGYVWAPAWVYWRFGDGYVGWMPAPPDALFLGGFGIGLAFGDWGPGFYGYSGWYGGAVGPADLWFFVGGAHFADADFARFAVPRRQVVGLIGRTRNVTRYSTVRGVVTNRSIRVSSIEHLAGHTIHPVAAHTLLHGNARITPASLGRSVAQHERAAHPIPAAKSIAGAHHTVTPTHVSHVTTHAHHVTTHVTHVATHHHVATTHSHGPSYAHMSSHRAMPGMSTGAMHGPSMAHGPSMMHAPSAPHPASHGGAPPKPHG